MVSGLLDTIGKERLKKKVKIGNSLYKIYSFENLRLRLKGKRKFIDIWGFCNEEEKEIYIKDDLNKKNFKDTLIHEMIHSFLYEIEKSKGIKNKRIIKKLNGEEDFISTLSFLIDQNFKLK